MSATKYHADRFPPRELDWPRLLPLIGPANAAVARYEGVLHGIPNANVLLSPLSTQEAVLSNFYISEYLENRRDCYYERLLEVSRNDDWSGWCEFFLTALIQQAQSNQNKALGILDLYRKKKEWIAELTHSHYAVRALDWFFSRPIFKASDFLATAGIPKPTASRILRLTRDRGFLCQLRAASGRRPAIMAFPELLNIAEGKTVF